MAASSRKRSSLLDTGVIYCGDNVDQLKKLPDDCIDLIYLDPPFNSNRNYEVFWGETKEKRAFEDRHESTQAYIEFMRPRCVEMARVLKETGSFYYHCDWHASHYVKVMLDQIFGENNFINEIAWKRQTSHNDAKQGSKHFGRLHDVLLFYTGGSNGYTWNQQYVPLDQSYIESHYSQVDDKGRPFQWGDLRWVLWQAAREPADIRYCDFRQFAWLHQELSAPCEIRACRPIKTALLRSRLRELPNATWRFSWRPAALLWTEFSVPRPAA